MRASETAYAKINLALHVRRREADGYHAIETLFAFCQDGDRLTLEEEPGLRLTGPFAAALDGQGDNLVTRAAAAFADRFGGERFGFTLDKRLPIAAGIGGGSADAAAALRLLCGARGMPSDTAEVIALAAELGADVPACLVARPVRGTARGDVLTAADGVPAGMPVLLVNPREPLLTADVFRTWDGVDRGALAGGDAVAAAISGRNDLELPARTLCPAISTVLDVLAAQEGVALARMSGSGATCFALFDGAAARDRAAHAIGAAHPAWWLLPTRLR
jgi:4-diphosphocytidyl-2-C-methyl-D-erythritol kinase